LAPFPTIGGLNAELALARMFIKPRKEGSALMSFSSEDLGGRWVSIER